MTEQPVEHEDADHVHTVNCSPAPELTAGAAFALYHYRTQGSGPATTDEFNSFWKDLTDEERAPYVDDARVAVAGVMAVVLATGGQV